ncbi:MAG: alternative ribosome rescue aminoacyl-tRNA hydrolase ArfB [Desulfobulbus sp.]|jgi:ribosome-associated protein
MSTLVITPELRINLSEVRITAVRSQGAGGQNVNKVASAVHLRFPIRESSLPDHYKNRLLALRDHRLTDDGALVIKAQESRSFEQNRRAALKRLADLIRSAGRVHPPRRPTRPSRAALARRKEAKIHRSRIKALRRPLS